MTPEGIAKPNHLVFHVRRYLRVYVAGLLMLIAATVAQQLAPLVLRFAVDGITDGTTGRALAGYAGIILLLAAIEGALRYYSRFLVSGSARHVEYALRDDMAQQLLNIDQQFYVQQRTGDLMARCTNDLEWIRNFTGPVLVDLARTIVVLAVGMAFLMAIDVRLALIALAYLPVVAVFVVYFETAFERRYQRVQDQFGVLTNRVQENISGIRSVKAHAQEPSEIAAFGADAIEMRGRTIALSWFTGALFTGMLFMTTAATGLVIWFGGNDVIDGRITLGELVQFITVLALMATQLSYIGWVVSGTQQGIVATRRINHILNAVPAITDPDEQAATDQAIRGEIELRGVAAGYQGEEVLHDIDVRIPAGATVALVGLTGAGKTTLVNLLIRLQDPLRGEVLIDGRNVREYSLSALRDAIGFVPQESFLFSDTLRDNIGYGRAGASDEEMQTALETSQLVNDLEQLSDGLDSMIGERGVTLSGGQKQRAALARALLKAPPILVLDDALSHVDTHTEEEILRRLKTFMRDRTTILIAHRTSTVQAADFVIALDGGTVAQMGTHAELIAQDGIYARIHRQQLLTEQLGSDIESALLDDLQDDGAPS